MVIASLLLLGTKKRTQSERHVRLELGALLILKFRDEGSAQVCTVGARPIQCTA